MEEAVVDKYSYEEYLEIAKSKENKRVELIFGQIYNMAGASAKHQDIVGNIYFTLRENIKYKNNEKIKNDCKIRIAPYDIKFESKDDISVVQPDVMVLCKDEKYPCAIFEVLSKSTANKDKGIKKELYQFYGIKEYFIVNGDLKIVDKYLLENGKYYYVKGFSIDEEISVDCLDTKLKIKDIFENIEE